MPTSPNEDIKSVLRMKFAGGRFELTALPASTLIELNRLSRIYIALAEDSWRASHTDRQRVPGGFAKRFELCVREIAPGSTAPLLAPRDALVTDDTLMLTQDVNTIAPIAARRLEQAFIEIIKFNRLPNDFPPKARRDMTSVFSSFDVGEYPEFTDEAGQRYDYTQAVRSNFLNTQISEPAVSNGRIAGRLVQLNTDKRTALLELMSGSQIAASFSPELLEDMRAGISVPEDDRFVVIEGTYRTQSGEISEILDIEEIFVLELPTSSAGRRLRELLSDDPAGEVDAISPEAAEATAQVLNGIESLNLPVPNVFPAEEGAVQLVWSGRGTRHTLEVAGADALVARRFVKEPRERLTAQWDTIADLLGSISAFLGANYAN